MGGAHGQGRQRGRGAVTLIQPPARRFRLPAGLAAVGEREYGLYFAGNFISQLGNFVEALAVTWILYALTHSPLALGLGGLFRALPVIVLSMVGGALADRWPQRPLLLVAESGLLLSSLTMGGLALTGHLQFWHLYLLNLVSGSLSAFEVPGRQALFPGLVSRELLPSAVTANALGTRAAAMIGPALSGLLLAGPGFAAPFLFNAVSFGGMLAALVAMRRPAATPSRAAAGLGVLDGLRFVVDNRVLRALVLMEIASNVFGHNNALITIIARDVLHLGPRGLGLLLGCLGAGSLAGMAALAAIVPRRRGRLLLGAAAVYCLALAAFGLSRVPVLSALLLVVLGTADGVWAVTRNVIAQLVVTDRMRGRVMSVIVLVTRGLTPLGWVQTGGVAGAFGGPAAAVAGAAVVAGAVLLAGGGGRGLRDPEAAIDRVSLEQAGATVERID